MRVLFVCFHNSARSQMAQAFFERATTAHAASSAGLHPGAQIDPLVIDVMNEVGIDLRNRSPRALTPSMVREADIIVRSIHPDPDDYKWPVGPRYIDWSLPLPADENAPTIDEVRRLRDSARSHAVGLALQHSFGVAAEQYHRARPDYPVDLVTTVAAGYSASCILEIGCGSGHATKAFVDGAREYVAIDISSELIAIAQRELGHHSHVRFIVGAFEDVVLPRAAFDLMIAAQSFHWIEPLGDGLQKANDLLVKGGRMALFWNFVRFDAVDFLREARDIILRYAASFERWPDSSDARYETYGEEWRLSLDETGFFMPARVSSFEWPMRHSQTTFLDWVGSLSWFRILSEPEQQSLLNELRELHPNGDDTFDVPVRSLLVCAEKVVGAR